MKPNSVNPAGGSAPHTICRRRIAFLLNFAAVTLTLVFSTFVLGQSAKEIDIGSLPISDARQFPPGLVDIRALPPASHGLVQHPSSYPDRKRTNPQRKYDVSRIGSRGIGEGINLYSVDRELKLGHELAAEIDAEVRLFSDPVVTDYITRVAQSLVSHSDAKVPFTVKVVDSDEVNAFALPGGYLYVNSGLLLASDNEAELAGVMAHEIAHVAARHATKTLTRKQLFNFASVPLMFVGGGAVSVISQVAGVAGPISFLKFSRNAEREADLLGLEYAYAAGYDPSEFVRFFERMRRFSREKKPSIVVRLLSTHPMTDDRIRRAQDEIATMLPPKEQYLITTSEFEEIKLRLARTRELHKSAVPDIPNLQRRTPPPAGPKGTSDP